MYRRWFAAGPGALPAAWIVEIVGDVLACSLAARRRCRRRRRCTPGHGLVPAPPLIGEAHFNLTVEYEKPVPVAMMITNPYVAHALFANRREPAPLDDEPTLLLTKLIV